MQKKLLLTGGTGFVGEHLAKLLNKHNIHIRYILRKEAASEFDCFYIENLDGTTNWKGAFDNINCVVHMAGIAHNREVNDDEFYNVNTDGTLQLALEAAKNNVKRFVFISTAGVNGLKTYDKPFNASQKVNPHNAYAKSKYLAEKGLFDISNNTGMEVVIIRPPLVYGRNAPGNFELLAKLIEKTPVLPFGLIDNKRDFVSVENLADLILKCTMHSSINGHVFFASDDKTLSIKEFTNAIAKGLDKRIIQVPVPSFLLQAIGKIIGRSEMIQQLISNFEVDIEPTKLNLEWIPPVKIDESLYKLNLQKRN